MTLQKFHTKYIKGTIRGAFVADGEMRICNLTLTVAEIITEGQVGEEKIQVLINTRILKHLYDKKPAEEYDQILNNVRELIKRPEHIFKNRDTKRGDFVFVKSFAGEEWFCSLQHVAPQYYLITCFRLRKRSYLNNYDLIWSWKDGDPSS